MHEYVQWQAAIKIMCILLRENGNKGKKLCTVLTMLRDRKCSRTRVDEYYSACTTTAEMQGKCQLLSMNFCGQVRTLC